MSRKGEGAMLFATFEWYFFGAYVCLFYLGKVVYGLEIFLTLKMFFPSLDF
jgi:hypothetical protein